MSEPKQPTKPRRGGKPCEHTTVIHRPASKRLPTRYVCAACRACTAWLVLGTWMHLAGRRQGKEPKSAQKGGKR